MAHAPEIEELRRILTSQFPMDVETDGSFDDWAVVAPSMVGLILELAIAMLEQPSRPAAEVLARSLAEYIVTFAFLAGLDEESRRTYLHAWVKDEFAARSKYSNAYEALWDKKRYRDVLKRSPAEFPRTMLSADTRQRIAEFKNDDGPRLPPVSEQAALADDVWMDRIKHVADNPFALIYQLQFRGRSWLTHASVTAVNRFVLGDANGGVRLGPSSPDRTSSIPYGYGLASVYNALCVSREVLGWPSADDLARLRKAATDATARG